VSVGALLSRLDFVGDPYAADPVGWARDVLGVHLWSRQAEIAESVRDHARTAVRSGHGVGKTTGAAVIALWFLDTHARSRAITTATKWSQVEKLLWHEIALLLAAARDRPQAKGRPIFAAGATALQTELRLPDGRYAIGLSSKPEQSESFAGHHAPHILLVVDEASGVPEPIFEVAEGYMTTEGARMLLIGNPTRAQGEFFDAFHSKRADYATLHISALESPAITGERVPEELRAALTGRAWVESRRRVWGEDSVPYQVRVLGQFARRSIDTVVALGDVEDAQEREVRTPYPAQQDDVTVAVDVARFGADETVITTRHGGRVRIREVYRGKDTTHTAARVVAWHRALREESGADPRIVVDDVGVGGGVTDQLRARELEVHAFNGGERARQPALYPNRRSEMWFVLAEALAELDLDGDDQLAAELTAPMFRYDGDLRRVVERKEDTKRRLGRSPDRADSVMLALAVGRWAPNPLGGWSLPPWLDGEREGGEEPAMTFRNGRWETVDPGELAAVEVRARKRRRWEELGGPEGMLPPLEEWDGSIVSAALRGLREPGDW
jgi:hypothetical protein